MQGSGQKDKGTCCSTIPLTPWPLLLCSCKHTYVCRLNPTLATLTLPILRRIPILKEGSGRILSEEDHSAVMSLLHHCKTKCAPTRPVLSRPNIAHPDISHLSPMALLQLKMLSWYAEPVVTLSVDVEPLGCTIKLLSCEVGTLKSRYVCRCGAPDNGSKSRCPVN